MREPVVVNGITRWMNPERTSPNTVGHHNDAPRGAKEQTTPVLREEIGEVLRDIRQRQGRTLREVSHDARVSLGYLSEVERGQKEASSELLASICQALEIPLSVMLREVSDRIAMDEHVTIPDTVPDEISQSYQPSASQRVMSQHRNQQISGGTSRRGYGQMAGSH